MNEIKDVFCDECNDFVEFKIEEKIEERNILNEKIKVKSKIAICKKCDSELFHTELEKENQKKAFDKYREERERKLNDTLENLNSVYDMLEDMSFKSEKIYNRLNAIEESILEILNKYN